MRIGVLCQEGLDDRSGFETGAGRQSSAITTDGEGEIDEATTGRFGSSQCRGPGGDIGIQIERNRDRCGRGFGATLRHAYLTGEQRRPLHVPVVIEPVPANTGVQPVAANPASPG